MSVFKDTVERLRALDPQKPKSPVSPPAFYAKEYEETVAQYIGTLEEVGFKIKSPDFAEWRREIEDMNALILRAKNRRRLAWMKIRREFRALAAGNARLMELFDLAQNAPQGGF